MYQPREGRRRCAREWQTQTNAPDDPDVVFSLQSGTTAAGHAWSGDRVGTRVELTRAKELTADAPILGLVGAVRYAQLPQRIPAEFANLPVVVDAEMELKKKAREVARQVESLGGKGGAGSEGGDPKKDAGAGGALESAEDPVVLWGVDFSKSGRHVWSRRGGVGAVCFRRAREVELGRVSFSRPVSRHVARSSSHACAFCSGRASQDMQRR